MHAKSRFRNSRLLDTVVRPARRAALGVITLALPIVLSCLSPGTALAGTIFITPANVSAPRGGGGTFDVVLSNPAGSGQTFNLAGFSAELLVPTGSGVTLSTATTTTAPTSLAYLFQGNSFFNAHSNPTDPLFFPFATSISPTDLLASDTVLTPASFVTLSPGASFALAHVSFTVGSNAAAGPVPITFGPATLLSDNLGSIVSGFTTSNGQITITGPALPAPSSLLMAAISGGLLSLFPVYHRYRSRSEG